MRLEHNDECPSAIERDSAPNSNNESFMMGQV
jgi:hypothetical protein